MSKLNKPKKVQKVNPVKKKNNGNVFFFLLHIYSLRLVLLWALKLPDGRSQRVRIRDLLQRPPRLVERGLLGGERVCFVAISAFSFVAAASICSSRVRMYSICGPASYAPVPSPILMTSGCDSRRTPSASSSAGMPTSAARSARRTHSRCPCSRAPARGCRARRASRAGTAGWRRRSPRARAAPRRAASCRRSRRTRRRTSRSGTWARASRGRCRSEASAPST